MWVGSSYSETVLQIQSRLDFRDETRRISIGQNYVTSAESHVDFLVGWLIGVSILRWPCLIAKSAGSYQCQSSPRLRRKAAGTARNRFPGGAHALPGGGRSYSIRWLVPKGLHGNPLIYNGLNFQRELRPVTSLSEVPQQSIPVNGAAQ